MAVTTLENVRNGAVVGELTWKDVTARAAFALVNRLETAVADFRTWRNRRRTAAELYALSDSMLKDIGLTRGEIKKMVRDI